MNILEGLFGAIVFFGFGFWIIARVKRISVMELYNRMMNSLFGIEYDDIGTSDKIENFRGKKLFKNVHVPSPTIHKSRGKIR